MEKLNPREIGKKDENELLLNKIVKSLVNPYTSDLDDYLLEIKSKITSRKRPMTDAELEDAVMQLPTFIYFLAEGVEIIGIKEDFSKIKKNEAFNQAFIEAVGTAAVKKAQADSIAQNEELMYIIASTSYKLLKRKLEAAQEILHSVKKIMTKRIADSELSNNKYSS